MRYWTLSLAATFFVVSAANAQFPKKDFGKGNAQFPKKDLGKDKEPPPPPPVKSMMVTDIQGRSFNEWRKDITDKDPTRRELAIKAVMLFGPEKAYEALPAILAELKTHSNARRIDLSTCVAGSMALSTLFKYKWESQQEAFATKGLDPKDIKLKGPDLKDISKAVAIYKTFLKDEQLMLRIQAVQGLTALGPNCRDALPEVISLAKERSTWEARKEAVQVLGFIGYEDNGTPKTYVMGEVFKALDDHAAPVRIAAIRSCAALARKLNKADIAMKNQVYGKLKAAMADPEKHVVLAAHLAHMTLEEKVTPAHLNPMLKLLKDANPEVRLDALQNIGALGAKGSAALPAVKECTDDPEASVATNAVLLLAGMDWENSRALIERIKDSTKYPEAVRAAARNAVDFHEKMAKDKKTPEKK